MKKTISVYAFREEFQDSQYKDNFTYEGLATLFDILEQYEQDTEQEQELDIVAIAWDYIESTLEEIQKDYTDIEDMYDLEQRTTVWNIPNTNRFIYQSF